MEFINGYTFLLRESKTQGFADEKTRQSLKLLKDSTGCNYIVLAFGALQDTAQSEQIDFKGPHIPTDEELLKVIGYARELGLKIILKPMLNCRNGVWRAHINFFDKDVPCEPKWSVWFENYMSYIVHFAEIAQKTECEILMIGCEMVQSERMESYWRELVRRVRQVYHGPVTYNTDKYQEDVVKWWDCLDIISSSGYYPQDKWEENLDRIEQVVKKYNKPFFFAECGCMCREGCTEAPNDWTYQGKYNLQIQADYFKQMFEECSKRSWIEGFGIWAWVNNPQDDEGKLDDGYGTYGKPSCQVIKEFYTRQEEKKGNND